MVAPPPPGGWGYVQHTPLTHCVGKLEIDIYLQVINSCYNLVKHGRFELILSSVS